MSDEKRIEELANDIASICPDLVDSGCMGYDCVACLTRKLEKLGYRKQNEGEWIVTDADSGSFGEYEAYIEFKCPKCERDYGIESGQYGWAYGDPIPWVSCPLCGAKMKGGAE